MEEHVQNAISVINGDAKRKINNNPLYGYWAKRGIGGMIMIPIKKVTKDGVDRAEAQMIYQFPGQLNG